MRAQEYRAGTSNFRILFFRRIILGENRTVLPLVKTLVLAMVFLTSSSWAQTPRPGAAQKFEAARAAEAVKNFDEAIEDYREVVYRWPASAEAPDAQLRLALIVARTGKTAHALLEFQQVRTLFPESAAAATALQHMSTLYRWHRSQLGTVPTAPPHPDPFLSKVENTGLSESFEDPQSAFFDARNDLLVFDKHRKRVIRVGSSGEVLENTPFASPHAMARPGIGADGVSYLVDGELLRILGKTETLTLPNPQKKSEGSLKNITALGLSASHDLWATSSDLTGVLRFPVQRGASASKNAPEVVGVSLIPKNIRAIEFDYYGNVYFFDSKQGRILVTRPNGEIRTMLAADAASFRMTTITDFYIDLFNQLYLLDAEERVVAVFSIRDGGSQGLQFLPVTRVLWGQMNPSPEFRTVRTFAVANNGELVLIPRKSTRILKIY